MCKNGENINTVLINRDNEIHFLNKNERAWELFWINLKLRNIRSMGQEMGSGKISS